MKNKLSDIIKERLENRYKWRNYLGWLLTHKELQMQAKKDYYKDKLILNLIFETFIFSHIIPLDILAICVIVINLK